MIWEENENLASWVNEGSLTESAKPPQLDNTLRILPGIN